MKWFADASYAINDDCKGHWGHDDPWEGDTNKFLQKTKAECKKFN